MYKMVNTKFMYIKNIYSFSYFLEPSSYNPLKICPTFLATFFVVRFLFLGSCRAFFGPLLPERGNVAPAVATVASLADINLQGISGDSWGDQGWVFRQRGVQDPTGNKAE